MADRTALTAGLLAYVDSLTPEPPALCAVRDETTRMPMLARMVSSAAQAYEVVESWRPNVILADLAMPGEDGFMLASSLRATLSEHRHEVSLIAVTAYGTPESRARAAQAGFDLYLTKPVDPLELAAAVARVMRRAR